MSWLLITISFYFILALVFIADKYLLSGPISNPKLFTFYIGILNISVLFLIPFVGFYIPDFSQIILSFLTGIAYVYALFWFYKTLFLFETSRVIPAISGLIPLFTFVFVYFFSSGKETPSFVHILAFVLLVLGSVFITLEEKKIINLKQSGFLFLSAFLFSLSFVLAKYVYLAQSFWNGFIWIRIGVFLTVFFLFLPTLKIKKEIFQKGISFKKETFWIFILSQIGGALATVLQNLAFALAPLAYIAVINALQGLQYVFLLIFSIIVSLKFPHIIKEEINSKIIIQKIFAIILIGGGLVLLAL